MSRPKSSMGIRRQCPLDDPDIGIITELDHQTGQCICILCTCGQHICPARRGPAIFPKSMYRSNYSKQFRPSIKIERAISTNQERYRPRYEKMSYQTTSQEAFQGFTIQPQQPITPESNRYDMKFVGHSSNKNDYPNWGPVGHNVEKAIKLPYRGQDVQLDSRTTYKQQHGGHRPKQPSMKKYIQNRKYASSSALKGCYESGDTETVSSRTFRYQDARHLNEKIKRGDDSIVKLQNPSRHFSTTVKSQYTPINTPTKDPKAMLRQVNKKIVY